MNLHDLIIRDSEAIHLADIFLDTISRERIQQLIREQRFADQLLAYGLPLDNKILLEGASGCGKTTTAKAIAQALEKPLLILNLSNVINSRIGETSQNIKMVFDKAGRDKGVLFLDEFDQIGKSRSTDEQDVGEMRRIVNTIIQLIDYYPKSAMLICATNHASIIDPAILRRFQVKISFDLPDRETLNRFYKQIVSRFPEELQSIERRYGISYAEAKDYAFTLIKARLLERLEQETLEAEKATEA